jgi:REP element-mobilizing transposase RayT
MSRQYSLRIEKIGIARKTARAISTKGYNHIVVKARVPVLRLQYRLIQAVLMETQRRFGIELRAFAVMPDHCHLIVKVGSRSQFANALRFFSGQVALKMKRGRLWAQRAWSRVVRHGRDYVGAVRYVWRNPIRAGIFSSRIDTLFIVNGALYGSAQWEDPPDMDFAQGAFAF